MSVCREIVRIVPEFGIWLRRLHKVSRRTVTRRLNVALDDIPPKLVAEVAQEIAKEVAQSKMGWSRFVDSVISRSVQRYQRSVTRRMERETGQELTTCPICDGDGLVKIVDPPTLQEYLLRERTRGGYTALVRCSCEAGRRVMTWQDVDDQGNIVYKPWINLATYDPGRHCRYLPEYGSIAANVARWESERLKGAGDSDDVAYI